MKPTTLPACNRCNRHFWPSENATLCPLCENADAAAQGLPSPGVPGGPSITPAPRLHAKERTQLPKRANPQRKADFDAVRGCKAPQWMFSCPSCMTMLALKQPYDPKMGALTCPHCTTAIVPPTLA